MHSNISSSVSRYFCRRAILTLASMRLLMNWGSDRRGSYRIWNRLIIVNVFAEFRVWSVRMYIAKVALTINMGLNHRSSTLRQPIPILERSTFISIALRLNNLFIKNSSRAFTFMNLI